ncbi:hypothetical protein ACFQL8_36060 [Streptomyces goshikiensis]|uniref:hypothetical protein n=1 Tax=Streptomyces goshikiensis TaxID=1942 RepID=UPI003605CDE2
MHVIARLVDSTLVPGFPPAFFSRPRRVPQEALLSDVLSFAERAEFLHDQLSGSGARSGSRSARRLRQSPAANVLIGVALHGAARREQGLELTGLEQRLTDQLVFLFGEEMVAEFGRIYQEPVSRAGAGSLFPALVAGRPVKEGVGVEDVRALMPWVQAEVAGLPSVRQVTVEELGQGVLSGEEEVVVVTGAPTAGTEFEVDELYEVRVRFAQFRCDRASGEVGTDEIYWASGAASESKPQIVMLTPEFGSVSTGTVKQFGQNAYWFKGPAEKFVGGSIQVWEADPGGANYNKIRQALADIARTFAEAGLEDGPTWDAVFQGLVAAAAALVNWILGFNKDDFVAEKSLAFTRDALNRMAGTNGGRSDVVFDGGAGGKHTLTLHVSFGPVIAAGLSHAIFYNGEWSKGVHVPHLVAATRPSMAVGPDGKLHASYLDVAGYIKLTSYDGESWSDPVTAYSAPGDLPRAAQEGAVTLVLHNGELLMTYRILGSGWGILAGVNPQTGALTHRLTEGMDLPQPALLSWNGDLLRFQESFNNNTYLVRVDVLTGSGWKYSGGAPAQHARKGVAVVEYNGWVYLSYLNWNTGKAHTVMALDPLRSDWRDAPSLTLDTVIAPSAAVATFGLYSSPVEGMFTLGYQPFGLVARTGLRTRFVSSGINQEFATREEGIRHGADIIQHQGTLHALYW